ncbi:MAG: hypothetical protein KAJ75_01725 [Alphaproteobacteria bacterium]|nr:hypothetical protein [Alphaproteobacteria bacterium]
MHNKKTSIIEQFDSSNTIKSGQKAVVKYKIPNTDTSITLLGDEKDIANLKSLIDRSAKSELAREGMEIAGKGGYTLEYAHVEGAAGECTKDGKFITLSPHITENSSMYMFAHEIRHAGQFERGADEDFGIETVKSEIIKFRASEADAQTAAVGVCYELALKGDKFPILCMKRDDVKVVEAFEKAAAEKGGVESGKAQTEAFKGWYDNDKVKQVYEMIYEVEDMHKALREGTSGDRPYDKVLTGEQVVAKLCFDSKKGNYFTDNPKILESDKYVDIGKTTLTFFKNYFKEREDRTGKAPDKSIDELPVRGHYGNNKLAKTTAKRQEEAKKRVKDKQNSIVMMAKQRTR